MHRRPRFPPLRAPLVRVVLLAVVLVVVPVVVVVIVRVVVVVVVVLSVLRVVVGVVISDERYLTSAASSMGSFFIGRLNPTRKVQEEKRSLLGTGSRACVHKRRGQRRRGQRRGQRHALVVVVVVVVVVLCSSLLTSFFKLVSLVLERTHTRFDIFDAFVFNFHFFLTLLSSSGFKVALLWQKKRGKNKGHKNTPGRNYKLFC